MGSAASFHLSSRKHEGQNIPSVTFKVRVRKLEGLEGEYTWKDVSTEDLFQGKRIALFSIPGAFTPVCSGDHLPLYEKRYEEIQNLGVDDVYCISVNDTFVMRQWGITQHLQEELKEANHPLNPGNFRRVKLIPDAAGDFTRAMGMIHKFENPRGPGERSLRYAAVINDMKIEKLFLEEPAVMSSNTSPTIEVLDDAEQMLHYLESTSISRIPTKQNSFDEKEDITDRQISVSFRDEKIVFGADISSATIEAW